MAKSKLEALGYANFDRKGIVKVNVPLWKHKVVVNPEVDMPFEEFINRIKKFKPDVPISGLARAVLKQGYDNLRKAVVVDGPVSAEYIRRCGESVVVKFFWRRGPGLERHAAFAGSGAAF